MKIQLKDLQPNPFRDYDNYPINQEKVDSLVNSIDQTGFWDNILARRKKDGGFELAYGHHRLIALEQLFTPDHEIDIPVKELDDATMIRIMAHENDEYWNVTPRVIDETVRVARKFLKEHPECVKIKEPMKYDSQSASPGGDTYTRSPEAAQISSFLGANWNERKVYYSLQRLGLIEEEKLDKEAIESLPTDKAAQRFTSAVKSMKDVTPAQQRRAAKRIVESGNYSKYGIERALLDESDLFRKKTKPDKDLIRLNDFIHECNGDMEKLNRKIEALIELKKEVGSEIRVRRLEKAMFESQARMLIDNLLKLGNKDDTVSTVKTAFKLLN